MIEITYREESVQQAFLAEYRRAMFLLPQPMTSPGNRFRLVSGWSVYKGPETPAFRVYMRWGLRRAVLSTISAIPKHRQRFEDVQRQGRMTIVMGALEGMLDDIEVENVLNPVLAQWLERRGYVSNGNTHLPSYARTHP